MLEYIPHFIPSSVVLIGAGGTGSRLMPMLAQLVKYSLNENNAMGWLFHCPIYVYDGDIVEDKNLTRQNFIQQDVGRNKAVVLAERYSNAMGIPIHAVPDYFQQPLSRPSVPGVEFSLNNSVIILAVDSAKARRTILETLARQTPWRSAGSIFVVDAGNEDDFGQVMAWTPHMMRANPGSLQYVPEGLLENRQINWLPFPVEHYNNLGESAQELSCEDLPQTQVVNALAATNIMVFLQLFFQRRPIRFHTIRFDLKGGNSCDMNTPRKIHGLSRAAVPGKLKKEIDLFVSACGQVDGEWEDLTRSIRIESRKQFDKLGLLLKEDGSFEPKPVPVPVVTRLPISDEKPLSKEEVDTGQVKPKRKSRAAPRAQPVAVTVVTPTETEIASGRIVPGEIVMPQAPREPIALAISEEIPLSVVADWEPEDRESDEEFEDEGPEDSNDLPS